MDDESVIEFDFPREFPLLESSRLVLRPIAKADEDSVYELYSDPRVAEFDDFEPYTSRDQARRCVERTLEAFLEGVNLRWSLATKADGRMIGSCGLSDFDEDSRRAEIGYDLLSREWGKGYMTEALSLVVAYGFERMGLNRVEAFVTPGNEASLRVLIRNGFVREGLVRERDFFRGRFWDGVLMAVLRRDWEASRG